jgi:hypothetical protein
MLSPSGDVKREQVTAVDRPSPTLAQKHFKLFKLGQQMSVEREKMRQSLNQNAFVDAF